MKMRDYQNLDSWAITALRLTQVVSASLQAFPTFKVSRVNIIWNRVEPCLLLYPGVKHQLEEKDLVRLSEII